jgi:hypothetical protein
MKNIYNALFLFIYLASCEQGAKEKNNKEEFIVSPVDSSKNLLIESKDFTGVIIDKGLYNDTNSFTPTPSEIKQAEKIFIKCLYTDKIGSDSIEIRSESIQEPNLYYRQYFGYINEKGEKTILFNCFTKEIAEAIWKQDWKRRRHFFSDGGNSFFKIVINLTSGNCSFFMVNGEA